MSCWDEGTCQPFREPQLLLLAYKYLHSSKTDVILSMIQLSLVIVLSLLRQHAGIADLLMPKT